MKVYNMVKTAISSSSGQGFRNLIMSQLKINKCHHYEINQNTTLKLRPSYNELPKLASRHSTTKIELYNEPFKDLTTMFILNVLIMPVFHLRDV